jgi:hypothetical protein
MSIPEVKKILDDYQNQLKKDSDIDYENDIKPWLGREVAFMMPDVDTINHSKPGVLVTVATKNKKKTDLFWRKCAASLKERVLTSKKGTIKGLRLQCRRSVPVTPRWFMPTYEIFYFYRIVRISFARRSINLKTKVKEVYPRIRTIKMSWLNYQKADWARCI